MQDTKEALQMSVEEWAESWVELESWSSYYGSQERKEVLFVLGGERNGISQAACPPSAAACLQRLRVLSVHAGGSWRGSVHTTSSP